MLTRCVAMSMIQHRPERQEVDVSDSDLVEIAKRSSEFSKHYGKWWGGFIQLSLANKAAGRRPVLWSGGIAAGLSLLALVLKIYWFN
jgi:hypothetical protein